MFSFKEWIILQEQPHLKANEPLNFKLGGVPYKDILYIDPNIERFQDKQISRRLFQFFIGDNKTVPRTPPSSIYFIDDNRQVFELEPDPPGGYIGQVKITPPTERVMPDYWWHNAVFVDIHNNVIDNSQPASQRAAAASF